MKILALELSTARGSIVWQEGEAFVEENWPNGRKNSGPFFAAIKTMMDGRGSPEMIVVGLGPGSYAGVRIAISTAIGLQAASGARLVGIPSICAMSTEAGRYDVIGDARRQTFFFARVERGRLRAEPELMGAEALQAKLAGRAEVLPVFSSDALPQFPSAERMFPSALRLARIAQDVDADFALPPLEPMYLREPHITQPKPVAGSVIHS